MAQECTITLGERSYAVERGFGVLPKSMALGLPSQVAVDAQHRVHLYQRNGPPVLVFDPDGRFVGSYGEGIADPHGIYCSPDDRIFLVDRDAHQVIITSADGDELGRLGERHRAHWQEPFNHPTDAAVGPDGRIFVADGYGNARVHRFSAAGAHEHSWGEIGQGPGCFMTPHAVWVDPAGRVLVADRENHRIQLFTTAGDLLEIWQGFVNPMDIWVDAAGLVYVTDQVPSLHLLSPTGQRLGRARPSLNGAHGIFGAPDGTLYLSEMRPHTLTRLRPLD